MYSALSSHEFVVSANRKKSLGEIDEAVGGEKGIPDPDSLCCNYRADCNGSAAVSA